MKRGMMMTLMAGALLLASCGGAYIGYYAPGPPPPVRVEAFGPAPGAGYVWVNGYWGNNGGRYEWVGGRWAVPPHGRRTWVAGRWETTGGRYRWREGRWR